MAVLRTWGLATAAIVLLAAAAWVWFGMGGHGEELRTKGVSADATVISVTMSAGSVTHDGIVRPPRYYIGYRFTDSIGTPREGMTNGSGKKFSGVAAGDTIPIIFLPSDPGVSVYDVGQELTAGRDWRPAGLLAALGAVAAIFAGAELMKRRRAGLTRVGS